MDEMYLRRGADPTRWKVTARFSVQSHEGEISCVRLRRGMGPSEYFTVERFFQLFQRDQQKGLEQ